MRGMIIRAALLCLATTLGSAAPVSAQGSVLAELYGQGVHDYFAGRYFDSHDALSMAIAQGSTDPRCQYFRGLCLTRLGRGDEAEEAFKAGAQLEVTSRDRVYPIGRSLQRIQGTSRLALEKHRQSARVTARLQALQVQQSRYEQMKRAEGQVLRDPNRRPAVRPEQLLGPAPPVDVSDPFANEEKPPEVAQPAPTVIDSPAPATSEEVGEPAAPSSPATPGPQAEANPFDSPAPPSNVDNPFESTPAPAPAPTPADDDPFDDPFN